MGRGTVCEDCAWVTYYVAITWLWNRIMDNQASNIAIKFTRWHCYGMHGISGRGIVEYKCPFKGGYPSHYKPIPASYYMQMQLNMKATNSDWCHFVTGQKQKTKKNWHSHHIFSKDNIYWFLTENIIPMTNDRLSRVVERIPHKE